MVVDGLTASQTDGRMDRWMDSRWTDEWTADGQMEGWTDEWTADGQMDGWTDEWTADGQMEGWTDEWTADGQMEGWTDEWTADRRMEGWHVALVISTTISLVRCCDKEPYVETGNLWTAALIGNSSAITIPYMVRVWFNRF